MGATVLEAIHQMKYDMDGAIGALKPSTPEVDLSRILISLNEVRLGLDDFRTFVDGFGSQLDELQAGVKGICPNVDVEPILLAIQQMSFNFHTKVDLSPVLSAIGSVQQANVELAKLVHECMPAGSQRLGRMWSAPSDRSTPAVTPPLMSSPRLS